MPVVPGSRFSRHRLEGVPQQFAWACPNCGTEQTGKIEAGCTNCGSGKPGEAPATGEQERAVGRAATPPSTEVQPVTRSGGTPEHAPVERSKVHKVYRLIEYVFATPEAVQETLRRSLIGTVSMPNVTITGCIVDDLSMQQEDRLRMARMQPGVWMGASNPEMILDPSRLQLGGFDSRQAGRAPENLAGSEERRVAPSPGTIDLIKQDMAKAVDTIERKAAWGSMTDTDPIKGHLGALPDKILRSLGLALLVAIAQFPEQEDPEWLSQQEAGDLAEWIQGQVPPTEEETRFAQEPPPTSPEDAARIAQLKQAMADAAQPAPTYREPEERK